MDIREKLEVIAHIGDHISYKEDMGIFYDSALAKVIEDAYMALKNGVTVQTNADRIRVMSDEELANIMAGTPICKERYMDCLKDGRDCEDCLLEWLKQPAE